MNWIPTHRLFLEIVPNPCKLNPNVAIVILNWNGRAYLEKFLPSVIASSYPNKKIIVADNASADDSLAFISRHYPEVGLIPLPQNYGFAKGYNEALKQIKADYYVLLNSDVEVQPNWIEPVITLMEHDRSVAVCQPKILMYDNKQLFEYAGAAGGWLDHLGYPFARGRIFDFCEEDRGQYDSIEPVFWASGAAMFVRAQVYHQLNGLDEYFFAHQEEIDFCWRVQLAGYKIYACPLSVVYHVGGGTLPKGNQRKVFLNFRNNLIMLAKNLPLSQALWKIPFRFLLDFISAFKSLFEGQAVYFVAIFKAHFAFLQWMPGRRRKSVFPASKRGQLEGWYTGSVVWKHFAAGLKRFDQIVPKKR
ncbi:MAG TPA: glycosyltransferase family 2 protein [Chitinophagaceae bacterium]|nr:glycosyltransferase family 2 protein [Chitinophagaceae bacterium]